MQRQKLKHHNTMSTDNILTTIKRVNISLYIIHFDIISHIYKAKKFNINFTTIHNIIILKNLLTKQCMHNVTHGYININSIPI